jgi:hypothetical protein
MIFLPDDLRIKIFGNLTIDDLAEAAPVCRQFRDDCRHPSLSQLRTVYIQSVSGSTDKLVRCLRRMQEQGVLKRFRRLVIQRPGSLSEVTNDIDIPHLLIKDIQFLGFSSASARNTQPIAIQAGVLEALLACLPDMIDLDLSLCQPPPVTLSNVRHIKTLRWTHQRMSVPLMGMSLPFSPQLRELYMDRSIFHVHRQSTVDLMCRRQDQSAINNNNHGHSDSSIHILQRFGHKLERVSIRNCRYCLLLLPTTQEERALDFVKRNQRHTIPQEALIQFVRSSPLLQWFRSDLTPDNVSMLQKERLDIVFE